MSIQLRVLKVFIAAPNDVQEEMALAKEVIDQFNGHFGDIFKTEIKAFYGTETIPSMGRPEEIVLTQHKMMDYDIFIGVLWKRFGTPTGGKRLTGAPYLSGTEEEFYAALESFKRYFRPNILMYNCQKPVDYKSLDLEQFRRVNNFFSKFNPDGEHPGYVGTFSSKDEFKKTLLRDILSLVKEKVQDIYNLEYLDVSLSKYLKNIYFQEHNEQRNDAKRNLIKQSKSLKLIALTGHSYLSLHGNRFFNEVYEFLEKGYRFNIILIDQMSEVGNLVAHIELNKDYTSHSNLVNDSTGFTISYSSSMVGYKFLKEKFGDNIEVRFTDKIITSTLLMSENECFFEPYIYFDFQSRMRKAMTSFEIQINNNSDLYNFLFQMFDSYWESSKLMPINEILNNIK